MKLKREEKAEGDNYPTRLIIERMEKRGSPLGEYRARWDKGFYLERSYCEAVGKYYVLFYNARAFYVARKEDSEDAERKLYEKVLEAGKEQLKLVERFFVGKNIVIEDRTKYAE